MNADVQACCRHRASGEPIIPEVLVLSPPVQQSSHADHGYPLARGRHYQTSFIEFCVVVCSAGAALFFTSLLVLAAAAALQFPTLSGRVVDQANILDAATRASLTTRLAELEAKTTDQVVVVTLRSLQGTSIEDFGYQLGRQWKIGQEGKNNGALLIVAPTERKVRIEVGYGLEPTLTDAATKIIIEGTILPRFRANDYPGGIVRGVDDIIKVLTHDEEWKQRALRSPARPTSAWENFLIVAFVFVAAVIVFMVIAGMMGAGLQRRTLGARGRPRRHEDTAWGSSWGSWGSSSGSGDSWGSGGSSSGDGFSGGGGSFGGGGSSGSW